MRRILFRLVLLLAVLFIFIAYLYPFAIRVVLTYGPNIAVSISTIPTYGPQWARQFTAWVYSTRASLGIVPDNTPTAEKLVEGVDEVAAIVPRISVPLVNLFGHREVVLLLLGIVVVGVGINIYRRGGLTRLFGGLTRGVSTPVGLVTTIFGILIILLVGWSWFVGWERAFAAVRPIIPFAVLILFVVYFSAALRNWITTVVLGILAALAFVFALSIWMPDLVNLPFIRNNDVLNTVAVQGASLSANFSSDTVLFSSLAVGLVAAAMILFRLQGGNGGGNGGDDEE